MRSPKRIESNRIESSWTQLNWIESSNCIEFQNGQCLMKARRNGAEVKNKIKEAKLYRIFFWPSEIQFNVDLHAVVEVEAVFLYFSMGNAWQITAAGWSGCGCGWIEVVLGGFWGGWGRNVPAAVSWNEIDMKPTWPTSLIIAGNAVLC